VSYLGMMLVRAVGPEGEAGAVVSPPHLSWRVGTDLCSVSAVADSVSCFGQRYLGRIYTEDELAYCLAAPGQAAQRLAARFAAKEATIKVLRPRGFWPDWRTIEVRKDPGGWCDICLTGSAARLAAEEGIVGFDVSVSHENDLASAVVIAQVVCS
jgi:holo-[acyl-carrier protein] synthase